MLINQLLLIKYQISYVFIIKIMDSTTRKFQQLSHYFLTEKTQQSKYSENQSLLMDTFYPNFQPQTNQFCTIYPQQFRNPSNFIYQDKQNQNTSNLKQHNVQTDTIATNKIYKKLLEKNDTLLKRIQIIQQQCPTNKKPKTHNQQISNILTQHFSLLLKEYQETINQTKRQSQLFKQNNEKKYKLALKEIEELKNKNEKLIEEKKNLEDLLIEKNKHSQLSFSITKQRNNSNFTTIKQKDIDDDTNSIIYQYGTNSMLMTKKYNIQYDKMIVKMNKLENKVKQYEQNLRADQKLLLEKDQRIHYLELVNHQQLKTRAYQKMGKQPNKQRNSLINTRLQYKNSCSPNLNGSFR